MSTERGIVDRVERLVEPVIRGMGFDLVRVRFSGGRNRRVLQIMAEPREASPMSVADCAEISRTVSALLDVEDPLPGEYVLEVSSPGIDRPLIKRADFERFAGHEVNLEASRAIGGQRRFRGCLKGLVEDYVRIEIDGGEVEIALADIAKAKLVMSDDLLARSSGD